MDELKEKLMESVKNKRVSHTQLFFGPEGSANLALAIAYARYIQCSQPTENDACGKCPSCLKYFIKEWREFILTNKALVSYKDWLEFAGFGKRALIYTRDTREIFKRLNYKSFESQYKILIIWYPEKFFHSASHRLLKTLEEPPDKKVFILVYEYINFYLTLKK